MLGRRSLNPALWEILVGILDCPSPCGWDSGKEVGSLVKAAFPWEGWGGRWKSSVFRAGAVYTVSVK